MIEAYQPNSEQIEYQNDPQTQSDIKVKQMYNKLQTYKDINRTKRKPTKKIKKTILKAPQYDKQIKKQAQNIASILKNVRKNNIVQQFINKLKLNIIFNYLSPQDQVQYFSIGKTSLEEDFKKKIKQNRIFKLLQNDTFQIVTIIIKFINICAIFYINSLKIAFSDLQLLDFLLNLLIIFTIGFFCLQIGGMMVKVSNANVPFWKNFYYWVEKQHFIWEMIIQFGLILYLMDFPFIQTVMVALLIPQVLILINKLKRIEHSFVFSINFQRYYELLKIVLFNFCIAHILSIVLNLMGSSSLDGESSWYVQKNIDQNSDWVVRYIWGYYWGTTIMLTVGFGDISAQNHIQALILVFIETFACMIMAYNIAEVSKILQHISEMDQQKKLKFKVFNQMSQKYHFEDDFKTNVLNHIDKSIEKQHQLTYIEESLIEQLPEKIKLQVKRQVNKNVFKEAYFFKNLTRKTQNLLAQKVNKIFAHPEELILKNMETWKIIILRQGSVAITFKKGSSANNGTLIERFTVEQMTKPELLSLKFIRKKKIQGDLKSLDFSILNTLEIEHFQSIMKEHDTHMFEYYCSERDRTQFHQFDLEIKNCSICLNSKHDKISCPKMHFIPLKENIIYKKKFVYKGEKNERNELQIERKTTKQSSLRFYHEYWKDNSVLDTQRKMCMDSSVIPSYQFIGSGMIQNTQMGKKLDKCLEKVEEGLKLLKGMAEYSQQLQVDIASNYKRYFSKHNPDNLMFLNLEWSKRNKKLSTQQKKHNISSIL